MTQRLLDTPPIIQPENLTVQIPMALRKHGRRKTIVLPDTAAGQRPRIDNAMIKTLARAFRWKRLLDPGLHATIADLAAADKIDPSYLRRVLRVINLAPDIIETILDGRLASEGNQACGCWIPSRRNGPPSGSWWTSTCRGDEGGR